MPSKANEAGVSPINKFTVHFKYVKLESYFNKNLIQTNIKNNNLIIRKH